MVEVKTARRILSRIVWQGLLPQRPQVEEAEYGDAVESVPTRLGCGLCRAVAPSFLLNVRRDHYLLEIHDFLDLGEEPAVNFGQLKDFFDGEAGAEGVANEEDALGVGDAELLQEKLSGEDVAVAIYLVSKAPGLAVAAQAGAADLEGAEGFLQGFFEGSANGHGFADAFHVSIERRIGVGEFLVC